MCDHFAMLQQRYEDFSSEILILSFCVYVSTLHIFLLCLFSYSGLILVLTSFLFYPYCYSRCGRLSSYSLSKREAALLVHIRPYPILIFYHRLLLFYESRQKRFSCSSTLEPRSRPCAVGRLGTIERRRRVTVLVKP